MEEIIIKEEDKEKYLNDHHPFQIFSSLDIEVVCIHCNSTYKIGEYKVFVDSDGDEIICCANAPKCNGNALDMLPLE